MRIYYNSTPIPLAAARSKFFEANPSRELGELGRIFGAATNTAGFGVAPHRIKQARQILAAFGLEVIQ